jgi:hypothetical protein
MFVKTIEKLCTPALIYFALSLGSIIVMALQNVGHINQYCMGKWSCTVPSVLAVFMLKLLYVAFWTWVLNALCRAGYKTLSWVLLLLPFIFLFVGIAFVMLGLGARALNV